MLLRDIKTEMSSKGNPIVFRAINPINRIRRKDGGIFVCEFETGEEAYEERIWCVEEEKYDKEKRVKDQADFGFVWNIWFMNFADDTWSELYKEAEELWRKERK